MSRSCLLLASLAAVLFFAGPAFSQNSQQDVPTLTTEMVPPATVETPAEGTGQPDESGMTPEEKADADRSAQKGETAPADASGQQGPSPAEQAWRQELSSAQERARAAQQRADQAEIQLTNLRNNLGVQTTVDERNAMAAQIEQQGAIIAQARQEAQAARADLAAIQAEGKANDYSADPGPPRTTKMGGANAAYYQAAYDKALQELNDSDRQIQLYQDRVSQARAQMNLNSGSGDAFAQAKYTDILNQAEADLAKAQNAQSAAQAKIDQIVNEAQSAGVAVSQP